MALANYSDLTTAIASWTSRSDYTAANFSDFTTLFEAWVNRKIRTRNMELTATLTPVSGSVALPTDFQQWRRLTWTGSTRQELEYVHPSMLQAYYPASTGTAGTPQVFTIEGGNILIRPLSTTDLELDYWQAIPTLVSNSTNWLMTAHPDIYLAGVLTETFVFNRDMDNAGLWKARRDSLGDEINKNDQGTRGPAQIRIFGQTP